jgi:protein-S-isoprenylcysteine O-methyltransferase Ste14
MRHHSRLSAPDQPEADRSGRRAVARHEEAGQAAASGAEWLARIAANLAGAVIAGTFARASLQFFVHTHRLIGGLFLIEQAWFAVAFLVRRPPRAVSHQARSWLVAFAGTFGGLLLRPGGADPPWGVQAGFALQLAGLVIAITSLAALGRSFGFVAADRGLRTSGPYAVVRHPVYASYLLIQSGYVLQSQSLRNIAVVAFVTGCNIGRALAEERLLGTSPAYLAYSERVRRRLIPYVW